jgi:hypothetical protein
MVEAVVVDAAAVAVDAIAVDTDATGSPSFAA